MWIPKKIVRKSFKKTRENISENSWTRERERYIDYKVFQGRTRKYNKSQKVR